MAARSQFTASSGATALLNQIYDVKFSKHTPLIAVLLSMIYTVYRTNYYLETTFNLSLYVTAPTAVFIELLVVAASAGMFIALRAAYVAELNKKDAARATYGVRLSFVALVVSFVALLFVAGADAWQMTSSSILSADKTAALLPTAIMVLVQSAQAVFVVAFIIQADLDERELLRDEYDDYAANTCPYCPKRLTPNNRKRHIDTCPLNPKNKV